MNFDRYGILEYYRCFRLPFFIIRCHKRFLYGIAKLPKTNYQLHLVTESSTKWEFQFLKKVWFEKDWFDRNG